LLFVFERLNITFGEDKELTFNMLFLYNTVIRIYSLLVWLVSPFNPKAKLWTRGRSKLLYNIARKIDSSKKKVWFHFPSLGEFEQGRPVLEKIKQQYPEKPIIITFYSPSGYELRKNYPLADHVFYLPIDTSSNAKRLIDLINPEIVIFTKYDYWYHYFNELNKRKIPLFVISAIFRENHSVFKWYGGVQRQILRFITKIFVQNEESKSLLQNIGITSVTVAGDTRFDRVVENASKPQVIPEVQIFCENSNVFIAGSTWLQDEKHLADLIKEYSNWKFIIAPHEISESRISSLTQLFPDAIKFSNLSNSNPGLEPTDNIPSKYDSQVLIIDNIGMLSSLYQYGQIAYIGGGFGVGIHNTLEAATFGLPVIFGPNYYKFQEAKDLISDDAAFSINDSTELKDIMTRLQDFSFRSRAGLTGKNYVKDHTGATEIILKDIYNL
jgi:3-deoxy-D-manno-octulosonic-acid transferase